MQTQSNNRSTRVVGLTLAVCGALALSACVPPKAVKPKVNTLKMVTARNGDVPKGAFEAGADKGGQTLYICSVNFKDATHIGKVRKGIGGCHIGYGGKEKSYKQYEVGLGYGHWADASNGNIPHGAQAYGHEKGKPLYACRAQHKVSLGLKKIWQPGKVGASTGGTCNYAYAGKEHRAKQYQVLMP